MFSSLMDIFARKSKQKISRKRKIITFFILATFVLAVVSFAVLLRTNAYRTKWLASKQITAIQKGLQLEGQDVRQKTLAATTDSDLLQAIKSNNSDMALPAVRNEVVNRHLDFAAVMDKDGMVLGRFPSVGMKGDFDSMTTPWGRAISAGQNPVMIGMGKALPLILVTGTEISKNHQVIGSLNAGYQLDNDFANNFKYKYLRSDSELVFYSEQDGTVSSSFKTDKAKYQAAEFFNSGSDWIQKKLTDRTVRLANNTYFVKNLPFPPLEEGLDSPGGALLLTPTNAGNFHLYLLVTIILLLTAALLFYGRRYQIKTLYLLLTGLLAAVLVSLVFGAYQYRVEFMEISYKKPQPTIYNSTMRLSPENDIFDRAYEQNVAILVNSGGEPINTVKAVLDFDPQTIQIEDLLTSHSICNKDMFIEREIDNDNGRVSIACSLPTPGFAGVGGVLANLVIQPLKIGNFSLRFNQETTVLANDGLGTQVLRQATNGNYTVAASYPHIFVNGLPYTTVFSPTHPNSERWFNKRIARFSWRAEPGFNYVYSFDQNSTTTPSLQNMTADNSLVATARNDGLWYFHIAALKNGQLGPVTHYKIQIDTVPPEGPFVKASATKVKVNEVVRINLSSSDKVSGLQPYYYVKIDGSVRLPVSENLQIPFQEPGDHTVVIRAFDNADNFSDTELKIEVSK